MRKGLVTLFFVLFAFGIVGSANGALIDMGDGTFYDDVSRLYWYKNVTDFVNQTYDEQIVSIEALNSNPQFQGIGSGWHMATYDDMEALGSNSRETLLGLFVHTYYVDEDKYGLYGRYDYAFYTQYHRMVEIATYLDTGLPIWVFTFPGDIISDDDAHEAFGAYAASYNPIPLPATVWFLVSGLIGLVGFRKKIIINS